MNIFTRIKKFFGDISKRRALKGNAALTSRFGYFLDSLEPGSEEYAAASDVISLCDESVSVMTQRLSFISRVKECDEQLADLENYNNMTDNDSKKLKDMLERFVSLDKDKNLLKYQITDFDKSVLKLKYLEDEAEDAVKEIKEAETKQKIFRRDIGHLQGEKYNLEDERDSLVKGVGFVSKLTIGILSVFVVIVVGLVAANFVWNMDILAPLVVIAVFGFISAAMIIALNRRMHYEIALNARKQNKAVGMLKTKNAVYAHYTNFLTYEYNKYKVRNSEALKTNLKDLKKYKELTKRFDTLRDLMYQTEAEIGRLLRSYNISDVTTSMATFAKSFNVEDKKQYYREISSRKREIETDLARLDERQEQIWDALIAYDETDATEKHTIKDIIASYMSRASALIEHTGAADGDKKPGSGRMPGRKKYGFEPESGFGPEIQAPAGD